MFRMRSISTKFVLFTSLLILIPLAIFVGVVTNLHHQNLIKIREMSETLMKNALQAEWEEKVRMLANILAREFAKPMHERNISEMDYLVTPVMEGKGFCYVYVQDEKGRVLVDAAKGPGLPEGEQTDELTRSALDAEDLIIQRQGDVVDIAAPIRFGSDKLGVVRIGFSLRVIQETTAEITGQIGTRMNQAVMAIRRNTILFLPAIIILAMIAGWFFMRGLTVPIQKLVLGTEKIARQDLAYRIQTKSKDEIGQLVHSFNRMIKDLQETTVSKDYANTIMKSMDDALVVTSPGLTIQMVNEATCKLLNYTEDELVGKPLAMIFAEERTDTMPWLNDLIDKDSVRKIEKTYVSKDGRKIPVLFSGTAMRENHGTIQGIICVALDIAERKRVEEELKRAVEQRDMNIKDLGYLVYFSTLMNEDVREENLISHMASALQEHFHPDILAVLTVDKVKNVFNASLITPPMPVNQLIRDEAISDPSLCQVIRTGREFVVGDIDKDRSCDCIVYKMNEGGYVGFPLLTNGATSGMVLMVKKEKGYWSNKEIHKLLLVYIGLTASALQRVKLMDITRRAAMTDALTGAYNRRFFDEMLKQQIALAKRRDESLGLVIVDLDYFKKVNDTYGHIVGDQVLQQISRIMKNSIRSSDVLARYGGEEFVIVMPSIDLTNALKKAEGIRQHIESVRFNVDTFGRSIQITISIGVASFPEHGAEYDALVAAADSALYKAKEKGRNRVESP